MRTPSELLLLGTLLVIAAAVLLACGHPRLALGLGSGGLLLSVLDLIGWLRRRRVDRQE